MYLVYLCKKTLSTVVYVLSGDGAVESTNFEVTFDYDSSVNLNDTESESYRKLKDQFEDLVNPSH